MNAGLSVKEVERYLWLEWLIYLIIDYMWVSIVSEFVL